MVDVGVPTPEPNVVWPVQSESEAGCVVNGPHLENWTVPVGLPVPGATSVTVAVSVTVVPGATVPVLLACVATVVETITWKHSFVTVVDDDPVKLPLEV